MLCRNFQGTFSHIHRSDVSLDCQGGYRQTEIIARCSAPNRFRNFPLSFSKVAVPVVKIVIRDLFCQSCITANGAIHKRILWAGFSTLNNRQKQVTTLKDVLIVVGTWSTSGRKSLSVKNFTPSFERFGCSAATNGAMGKWIRDTTAGFNASDRSGNNPTKHSDCSWKGW